MSQDRLFFDYEGNNWFARNREAMQKGEKVDWPFYLVGFLEGKSGVRSIVELGCSNGYRLEKIRTVLEPGCRCVGIDASQEAIEDGKRRYPDLELLHGVLSDIPLNESFDLVIVNYVLHWIDRSTLVKSISEVDRLTKENGFLIIGDFCPDYPQRRRYHHLPDGNVFTYKQDYTRIFESFGTYRELMRMTYDHDSPVQAVKSCDSSVRGFCSILVKSLQGFYPEV